ncbi:MAG: hypothetical protein RL348_774 [Bacteroidota bacterium]
MNNKKLELNHKWTVNVEEDSETGEAMIQLPQELLDLQGWSEGTIIEWIAQDDGSYIIQKAKDGK